MDEQLNLRLALQGSYFRLVSTDKAKPVPKLKLELLSSKLLERPGSNFLLLAN
jgi:hypothetical protein